MVSANQSAMSEMIHKCHPCGKVFKSNEKIAEHKTTKKHKRNEKEYKKEHPTADDDSIFQSIS